MVMSTWHLCASCLEACEGRNGPESLVLGQGRRAQGDAVRNTVQNQTEQHACCRIYGHLEAGGTCGG